MIATQQSSETNRNASKYRPSVDLDQVRSHCSDQTVLSDHSIKEETAFNCDSSNQNNDIINRFLERFSEKGLWGIEHIKVYLHDLKRRDCRPNTLRSNFTTICLFLSYLKGLGRTCLESTTREDLGGFIEYEQDRGMKPNTVSTRLRSLYAFLGHLVEDDVVHPNLLKRKMRIKLPDTLPRAIDPHDIHKLLFAVNHVRNRAMILMLLRTGMRIGELLSLKVDDVNLGEKRVEIFEARKTRVGRVVYLSDDALGALSAWMENRRVDKAHLFYARGRSKMGYESARTMFMKYLEKAGLSQKGYTLHCLRHTFASELLNAGMRLECVQQLLGHSCIEMTRRYARLTDNTRKEEYFRAMEIIERGGINGHYRIDFALPQTLEAQKLLDPYD